MACRRLQWMSSRAGPLSLEAGVGSRCAQTCDRAGAPSLVVDVLTLCVQTGDAALTVRVLLGADEASRYDLVFGKDGLAATLDVKVRPTLASFIRCIRSQTYEVDGISVIRYSLRRTKSSRASTLATARRRSASTGSSRTSWRSGRRSTRVAEQRSSRFGSGRPRAGRRSLSRTRSTRQRAWSACSRP